ncbi:MAG: PfkB family carbohydrate kinase, partial [Pontibacterium sp.]
MLQVISFGEALVDMLSSRVGGAKEQSLESFTKYPGGAPANVAAAVAKLGGNSAMMGKIGKD